MRQRLLTLLVLLNLFCTRRVLCQGDGSTRTILQTERIANPTEVVPSGRFLYMCSIRAPGNRKSHLCGGILIHLRWVLTAAHCVNPNNPNSAGVLPIIYCGIQNIEEDDDKNIFYAEDNKTPEGWNGDVADGFDIALLKLDREANLFPIPRLATRIARPSIGSTLGVIGWGETTKETAPGELQYSSSIQFFTYAICNAEWKEELQKDIKEDIMICAGGGIHDTCKGDSGGPLLQADAPDGALSDGKARFDLIYGVISFGGASCGGSNKPGVYTFIGYFKEWIDDIIEGGPTGGPGTTTPGTSIETGTGTGSDDGDVGCAGTKRQASGAVLVAIENDDAAALKKALDEDCIDPSSRYNDASVTEGDVDDTLLHWAARYDASDSAQVLVDAGADKELRNNFKNTALHYCGIFDAESVAEVLLAAGAEVDASGNNGLTPMHYASRDGHLAIVKVLIKNGANVNAAADDGDTPLHRAAWRGHSDVAEELIDEGAEVDATDDDGETPLHYAARYGHKAVVEVLLDAGASKRIRDNRGNRPSSVVCSSADPECTSSTESAIEDLVSL